MQQLPNPQYDAYLNFLKNQTPAPTSVHQSLHHADDHSVLDTNTPGGITAATMLQHATHSQAS